MSRAALLIEEADGAQHDVSPVIAPPAVAPEAEHFKVADIDGQHVRNAVKHLSAEGTAALENADFKIVLSVRKPFERNGNRYLVDAAADGEGLRLRFSDSRAVQSEQDHHQPDIVVIGVGVERVR